MQLFLGGRYNKFSRTLNQTPWTVDGRRRSRTSVAELIGVPLCEACGAKRSRFCARCAAPTAGHGRGAAAGGGPGDSRPAGSGREDIDVRMLGDGRPFMVELVDPKRRNIGASELARLQDCINQRAQLGPHYVPAQAPGDELSVGDAATGRADRDSPDGAAAAEEGVITGCDQCAAAIADDADDTYAELVRADAGGELLLDECAGLKPGDAVIRVNYLHTVRKCDIACLRQGETSKRKVYSCLVWLSRPITDDDLARLNGTRALTVHQKTPIRVLHRRTLLTRPRVVHEMRAERADPAQADVAAVMDSVPGVCVAQLMRLRLVTQAGTYIKEFVHGDLGRTRPSIGTLLGEGVEADILSLDVCEVELAWPLERGDGGDDGGRAASGKDCGHSDGCTTGRTVTAASSAPSGAADGDHDDAGNRSCD